MFIYANELYVDDNEGNGYENALRAVAEWLSGKLRESVDLISLNQGLDWSVKKNSRQLNVWHTRREPDEYPWMTAAEYSHGDDEVSGRKWITQIGIKQQEKAGDVLITLLLETSDISADVGAQPVEPSRPYVVTHIEDHCILASQTVGQSIIEVERDKAYELKKIIDGERPYAIVLVSPDRYLGGAPVDLNYLRMQVVGLAQIIYIPTQADAYDIHRELGSIRSAYNGAVNILHPRVNLATGYIPHDLLFYNDIEKVRDGANGIEKHILRLIVHRQNLRHYWGHISPEKVRRHRLHQRLHSARKRVNTQQQSEEVQELISLYEETNKELDQENSRLKKQVDDYELEILHKDQKISEKKDTIRSLKYHLNQKKQTTEFSQETPPLRQFDSIQDIISAVEEEMGDRVLLQNRARKAMNDSPYQSPADVYQAFMLLYDDFYSAFSGPYDLSKAIEKAEEKNIRYAHKMSKITMGQSSDYSLTYNGRDADMNKHLKLGNSRNPQHCFRIHFEWDEDVNKDGMIVVHHAGKHLETTYT